MKFDFQYCDSMDVVRVWINDCEGKHVQQAIYSTFHDCLTQICYGCKKVRSNIQRFEK